MFKRTMVAALALFAALPLLAASDPTYSAVRAARPDGRTIAVDNYSFDRDVYHITLTGKLHLLAPVDGKTFGAVFTGQGKYELTPVGPIERRQLAIQFGDDKLATLADTFDSAVIFDADLLAKAGTPATGTPDPSATSAYETYLKKQRRDFYTNVHIRVLQEMLNGGAPLFFACIDGKKLPPALLVVDPSGVENFRFGGDALGGEQTLLFVIDKTKGGFWYLSHLKSEMEKGSAIAQPPVADGLHYDVQSTIAGNGELTGTTVMTVTPSAAIRVLPISLAGKLRVSDASTSADGTTWTPIAWVQEKDDEDSDTAVVFPAAIKAGEKVMVKLSYKGREVLRDAGDGNFYVSARQSWYPNVGTFSDTATFDLTFRFPQKFQVVAVGTETSNKVEGNERVSVWKAESPIRVAGFNYGRFKKMTMTDKDSGMVVDVYTNPGEPDIIREINQALGAASGEGTRAFLDPDSMEAGAYVGPSHVKVDTASLAQSALADGVNTARTANIYFGPLPQKTVSITQQSQWAFGQSWPGLIYLPYLAFLDGTTRNTLGLNGAKDFVDSVGPHEFGHQWWGHQIGFRSYHDEWLSEGFAEFTAALVLQQTGGWPRYNAFWEKARREILEKPRYATITNDVAGPISQGQRLATWQNGAAYDVIVYSKGAYVLHMLRMAMQDRSKPNPDEPFIAMMRDFAQTYAGKNPSTGDFQHIVEKHLTPALNLTKDGKVDWFFNQWVYGTTIPKFDSKIAVTDAGAGKYHISGTITQSQVTDDFVTVMPMYVQFDNGALARLGNVPVVGNSSKTVDVEIPMPRKPKGIVINAMHDVLVR